MQTQTLFLGMYVWRHVRLYSFHKHYFFVNLFQSALPGDPASDSISRCRLTMLSVVISSSFISLLCALVQ